MKKKLSATVLSFITVFFIFTSIANAWPFGTRYARPSYSPSYRVNWTDWTQVLPDLQIVDTHIDTQCDNGTALVDVTVRVKNIGGTKGLPSTPWMFPFGYISPDLWNDQDDHFGRSVSIIYTPLGHNETAQLYVEFDITMMFYDDSEIIIDLRENYTESNENNNQIRVPVPDAVYQCVD